jgi:membrane-associated PAP2 superfamily phosphatase
MTRAALSLLAATLVAALVFTFWPGLDLLASAPFHDTATGTWLAEAPALAFLREALWTGMELATLGFALLFLLALARRRAAAVPARLWGFALLAMALGPGLLVNGLLKDNWGRARPRTVAAFGGEDVFTPAFEIADQCLKNCSFVSGEVAAAATLSLVLWLLASARLRGPARPALAAALIAGTALAGFLRLASGGHFLSDIVFAVLVTALLTLALWRLTASARAAPRLTGAAFLADLRAPFAALRRRK